MGYHFLDTKFYKVSDLKELNNTSHDFRISGFYHVFPIRNRLKFQLNNGLYT